MRRAFSRMPWASVDPEALSASNPATVHNLVNGQWVQAKELLKYPDPLNGGDFVQVSNTSVEEAQLYYEKIKSVPKSGLHNPLKNVERYLLYGEVCQRAAALLNQEEVFNWFVKLVQRLMPKHVHQCAGEMNIIKHFCENFSGDSVRFLARGFSVPGDHLGQESRGYRWPYGPVAVISPFNFPLEIPAMQMMGALFMGNHVTIKPEPKMSLAVEQWIRFLHYCGMPLEDVNLLNGTGEAMEFLVRKQVFRNIQFTGSSAVSEKLCDITKGKVKVEDSGYDWKVLGPDVHEMEYVAWTCDQDAFALGGQKCSAQSLLLAHQNWMQAGIVEKIKQLAERRSLEDLTICPVLSWNNERIQAHVDAVLNIPGAKLLFGGKPLENHNIPSVYGSYYPTAVFVPIEGIKSNPELCLSELFGPFQIVTEWTKEEDVLEVLEMISHHLTAAVVSKDTNFTQRILANTVNGTTYAGIRARTTGAPQNHWFGPAGDPRAAGIGTIEAITNVWSCHREIIQDQGPIPSSWQTPPPS